MDKKRIMIATGGTGGHVFPALGLLEELQENGVTVKLIGAGFKRSYFASDMQYERILAAPIPLKKPVQALVGICKNVIGFFQALWILFRFKPTAIVGMGSYYTFPALLAAKLFGTSIVLHEGNAKPGKVNKLFRSSAKLIGVQFPSASADFKRACVHALLPLRPNVKKALEDQASKHRAQAYYKKMQPGYKTILLMGGSQGAHFLNEVLPSVLAQINGVQVIHLAGDQANCESIQKVYDVANMRAIVKPFESKMEFALSIADFFVGRSGAGTIAELISFKIPALFIPYPYATDDHQSKNADWVCDDLKFGYKVLQSEATIESLLANLKMLIKNEQALLSNLQEKYSTMNGNDTFARRILAL